MKITCKVNTYYKNKEYKNGNFTLADPYTYWMIDNPNYIVEYRLEIQTLGSEDNSPIILVSKVLEKQKGKHKREYIGFHKISYIYNHLDDTLYCATLIQKV